VLGIDLSGKVALVTGASQGIGAVVAQRFAEAGCQVVIGHYPSDACRRDAQAVTASIEATGGRARAVPGDVSQLDSVATMMEHAVGCFGHLDILVNNAGIIRDKSLRKMEPADWDTVIATNLTGVWACCRAASEILSEDGRIVSLASISAQVGFFGQANYAAAKAGVIGLTRVLSKELAKRRITVNAVAPGVIKTAMADEIPEAVRAQMLPLIPLGRFGEPREIADVVLFLCSSLASYVTGQTISVNGGWYCG